MAACKLKLRLSKHNGASPQVQQLQQVGPLQRQRLPCSGSRNRRAQGFSYLWTLFLLVFMGVSLTAAIEIDATVVQRDREKELLAIGRQFQAALGRYYEGQPGPGQKEYPATLEDLLQDPRSSGAKRYLRKIFVDPTTGQAEWGLVKVAGRIVAVHSLSNKTPIKQANFEAPLTHFAGSNTYAEWVFAYPPDLLVGSNIPGIQGVSGIPGAQDAASGKTFTP